MANTATPSAVSVRLRASSDRGHADHQWLLSYHTFSFASYYDPSHMNFGALRVINEDRVEPTEGFGFHRHSDANIFSYIIRGELEHKDSLGGLEIMKRGDVQMTTTGTGIAHSEYNRNTSEQVHFLQIWATPEKRGLKPDYYHRHFSDESKRDALVKIVAPIHADADVIDKREADGPAPIYSDLTVHASILSPRGKVAHTFGTSTRRAYVHLIMSAYRAPRDPTPAKTLSIVVKDGKTLELAEGDGAFIDASGGGLGGLEIAFSNSGAADVEFLLFEMAS